MAYEHKPNSGSLFSNEKKGDTSPDYKGSALVGGVEYWVSLWKGHIGKPHSLKFTAKEAKPPEKVLAKKPTADLDDEIPFSFAIVMLGIGYCAITLMQGITQ